MISHPSNGQSREELVDQVIADFLQAKDAGSSPDPLEWLTRFPEIAPQLARFFADQNQIDNLLGAVKPARPQSLGGSNEAADPEMQSPALPSSFGDYEFLSEIARGGMGVVYKARQRSLGRILAVKMILAGRLASAVDVRRFKSEAEAVAQLDHPCIVPVYEVGEHEGQPYFTMKLIEGGSLAQQIARFTPAPRESAQLLVKVARAVHHAHERGVLHRDLKPANILLDSRGEPHLTDFGLFRRLDGANPASRSGVALGTPSYMAPEQALGSSKGVTTAADVYSLGAILYELLTGRPPFQGESSLETLRQVLERDPERPRLLNRSVPRDLETICLKCLERAPVQRYASAVDLALNLECYLNGEPITARPSRPLGRVWRWCRRRPLVAGLMTALFLSLTIGGGVAVWQWRAADEHARLADIERARAEESFRRAHRAVNEFCTLVNDGKLSGLPGLQPLRRELFEAALPYYENFVRERGQDPALRGELADTYFRIATITAASGPASRARAAYEKAVEIYQELARDKPGDTVIRKSLAQVYSRLGILQAATGEPAAAMASYQKARHSYENIRLGQPDDPALKNALTAVFNNLGNLQRRAGQVSEAFGSLQRAREFAEDLVSLYPRDAHYRENLAATYLNLADLNSALGHTNDMLRLYEQARDIQEPLVQLEPLNLQVRQNLAATYRMLGNALFRDNKNDRALEMTKRGHAILEQLAKEHPETNSFRNELQQSHRQLGHIHLRSGRKKPALSEYEKAREITEALVRLNPAVNEFRSELAKCYYDKAGALGPLGRPQEAVTAYEKARDLCRELVHSEPERLDFHSQLGLMLGNLAANLWNTGRSDEGLAAAQEALEQQRLAHAGAPEVTDYRRYLGTALAAVAEMQRLRGRLESAVNLTLERKALCPTDPAQLFDICQELARLASAAKNTGPESEQESNAQRYADLAMATLRLALDAGFHHAQRLRTDPSLQILRDRSDFKTLLLGG